MVDQSDLGALDAQFNALNTSYSNLKRELTKLSSIATAAQELTNLNKEMSQMNKALDENAKTNSLIYEELSKLNKVMADNAKSNDLIVEKLSKLSTDVVANNKSQKLEWAINNADTGSFTYRSQASGVYSHWLNSKNLVRTILMHFKKGTGYFIDSYSIEGTLAECKTRFRDTLSAQIHNLIGHKPRIELTEGRYAIFYS